MVRVGTPCFGMNNAECCVSVAFMELSLRTSQTLVAANVTCRWMTTLPTVQISITVGFAHFFSECSTPCGILDLPFTNGGFRRAAQSSLAHPNASNRHVTSNVAVTAITELFCRVSNFFFAIFLFSELEWGGRPKQESFGYCHHLTQTK